MKRCFKFYTIVGAIMKCTGEQHDQHMCQLNAAGAEECILELAQNPAFACEICGAKADRAENLCSPQPIPAM